MDYENGAKFLVQCNRSSVFLGETESNADSGRPESMKIPQSSRQGYRECAMVGGGGGSAVQYAGRGWEQMGIDFEQAGRKVGLIGGRSDNCVKNHFYSKLRKSVRSINKKIHKLMRKEYREIKTAILYKII